MNNQMTTSDLTRLAQLSSQLVHGLDFPDQCDHGAAQTSLLDEMDRLDHLYEDSNFLFELRAAILSRPMRKQALYMLTHDLVREARGQRSLSGENRPVSIFPHQPLPGAVESRLPDAARFS